MAKCIGASRSGVLTGLLAMVITGANAAEPDLPRQAIPKLGKIQVDDGLEFGAPGPGTIIASPGTAPPITTSESESPPSPAPQAEPSPSKPEVVVREIQEMRSSEEGSSHLTVMLEVVGTPAQRAALFCCRDVKAIDDTGTELGIDLLESEPGGFDEFGNQLRLKPPARRATKLQELSGVVEVFVPGRDPQATVQVTGFVGTPRLEVSHPLLTAAGAKLTILTKAEFDRVQKATTKNVKTEAGLTQFLRTISGQPFDDLPNMAMNYDVTSYLTENSLILSAEDPHRRFVQIGFSAESGEPIPTSGWGMDDSHYFFTFPQKLPETAVMRLVLATPLAVVKVPFAFRDVPLP